VQGTGDVSNRSTRWRWQRRAGDDAGRGVIWAVQHGRLLLPTYHRVGGEFGSVGGSRSPREGVGRWRQRTGAADKVGRDPPFKTVRCAVTVGSLLPVVLSVEARTSRWHPQRCTQVGRLAGGRREQPAHDSLRTR